MKKFLQEFKDFAMRGNVLDLAVGIIIGAAFQAIVQSLVNDILSPLLGLFGSTALQDKVFVLLGVEVRYGAFITAVINFIIMAFIIFLLVKGMNKLATIGRKKEEDAPAPAPRLCPYCRGEVADDATRCPHCTSMLADAAASDGE